MSKFISPKVISLVFGILVLVVAVGFYVAAYEEPTEAPPGGVFYPPINTGSAEQWKEIGGVGGEGAIGIGDNPYNLQPGAIAATGFFDSDTGGAHYVDPAGDSNLGGNLAVGGNISASNYPPGSCPDGQAIKSIAVDGSVICETVGGIGGSVMQYRRYDPWCSCSLGVPAACPSSWSQASLATVYYAEGACACERTCYKCY